MHVLFLCVPTPATVRIYCDVCKRVELETLQTFVPRAGSPLAHIAMPEVKNIPAEVSNLGSHGLVKWLGPRDIPILLAHVPVVTFHNFIEAVVGGAVHRAIPATENAGIEKPVLVEKLADRSRRYHSE